ncbi:hypothetical protein [Winogradskyella pulchriflava]|uniref:Uncharacterized protein n=1 Tax=Winogradskyella pulchriflava TaxID=1110688 RepID=A0ABV6Q667_9FLAO
MKNAVRMLIFFTLFLGCNKDENERISDPDRVAELMNANLEILTPGVFTINPDEVTIDNSIQIINNGSGVVGLESGSPMDNQITFNAPNGNVNAVGMRFGTSGPIYFVPVDANGVTDATATFSFLITEGICDDLSRICHDIRCYEFAQTTSGAISAANIQDVAMLCGNCDEPSCQGLLDSAECGLAGLDGSPRFNLTWSGNIDLDLYVTDPNGNTISYINPSSSSGGMLDIDCTGGCTGGNSENITWPDGGPSGQYTFYVNNFDGGNAPFNIQIRDNGQDVSAFSGSTNMSNDNSQTYTYTKQ